MCAPPHYCHVQVVYKDDLTWLKGIGCYVWDTPQILHAKKSYDLQSQVSKWILPNTGIVVVVMVLELGTMSLYKVSLFDQFGVCTISHS